MNYKAVMVENRRVLLPLDVMVPGRTYMVGVGTLQGPCPRSEKCRDGREAIPAHLILVDDGVTDDLNVGRVRELLVEHAEVTEESAESIRVGSVPASLPPAVIPPWASPTETRSLCTASSMAGPSAALGSAPSSAEVAVVSQPESAGLLGARDVLLSAAPLSLSADLDTLYAGPAQYSYLGVVDSSGLYLDQSQAQFPVGSQVVDDSRQVRRARESSHDRAEPYPVSCRRVPPRASSGWSVVPDDVPDQRPLERLRRLASLPNPMLQVPAASRPPVEQGDDDEDELMSCSAVAISDEE